MRSQTNVSNANVQPLTTCSHQQTQYANINGHSGTQRIQIFTEKRVIKRVKKKTNSNCNSKRSKCRLETSNRISNASNLARLIESYLFSVTQLHAEIKDTEHS